MSAEQQQMCWSMSHQTSTITLNQQDREMTPWSTAELGKQLSLEKRALTANPIHLMLRNPALLFFCLMFFILSLHLTCSFPEQSITVNSPSSTEISLDESLETCFVTERICSALVNERGIVTKRGHLLKRQSWLDSCHNIIIGKIQKLM